MNIEIGKKVYQPEGGFSALVLNPFPQKKLFNIPQPLLLKAVRAERLIGKLDGATHNLPDVNFFLKMFITKDATASSQIEGTKATLIEALKHTAKIEDKKTDADDIFYYIKALNYGIKRLTQDDFPLSLRLIKEMHKQLMTGARTTHPSNPGEFRKSQNYIGGTKPSNALFVPPPAHEIMKALNDFEKFLYQDDKLLDLIHIGLTHAQFETIHPFLDGNGRTGRLLITLLFYHKKLLEKPTLFLSSWFKKHQQLYYQRLNDYHNSKVESWIDFFLTAVLETAEEAIDILNKIRKLRDKDMEKLHSLGKREAKSGIKVLSKLFAGPIVTTTIIMKWTGFSRQGAIKLIERFISLKILKPINSHSKFQKIYIYKSYVDIFQK